MQKINLLTDNKVERNHTKKGISYFRSRTLHTLSFSLRFVLSLDAYLPKLKLAYIALVVELSGKSAVLI